MNDASHRLLTIVLAEPGDVTEIAEAFHPSPNSPQSDEFLSRLVSMMRRLEHLGLIHRVMNSA